MTTPSLVFIDVDTQRDFLEPDGALFIAGSDEILPNLARLSAAAREFGIPVIATACDHAPDDEEFRVFPPHCVAGTPGRTRVDATHVPETQHHRAGDPIPAAMVRHLTLSKQRYDVFHRHDAGAIFETYARSGATSFVVYGVATDYCVHRVVHGLLERGHRVEVVVDAIRAVDPAAEADVLSGFVAEGATLTLTDNVLARLKSPS